MTVATETRRVTYAGNGVTQVFSVPFEVLNPTHLRLTYTPATGPSSVLVSGVEYTYFGGALVEDVLPAAAGSLPCPTGSTLTVERIVPLTQQANLSNQGTFDAETHEDSYDLAVMGLQQLQDRVADLEGGTLPSLQIGEGLEIIGIVPSQTLQVKEHADGSIDVSTSGVKVGVIATDAQHGNRGGASLHSLAISGGGAGFQSGTDKQRQDALWARTITAGAGMTGGGDLSANRTLDVVANADGSIVVNADDIQVGVLASDAQHGNRGGGALHAVAVANGANGFMSGTDKAKLDGLTALTQLSGSVETNDATPTTLMSFTPSDNSAEVVDVLIVGRRKSGSGGDGDSAGYRRTFTVRRTSGTTSLVGSATDGHTAESVAGWDVGVSIASPAVNITVTGAASTLVRWTGTLTRQIVIPA